MMMHITFMLVNFLLVLSSFTVQGSAGAYLALPTATSVLSHFKVGKLNLGLYRTSRAGLTLEANARALSPSSTPTFFGWNKDDMLAVQAPQFKEFHNLSPTYNSPTEASNQHTSNPINNVGVSATSSSRRDPVKKGMHGSASSPSVFNHKNHHTRNKFSSFAPKPHHRRPSPSIWQGPSFSPSQSPIPSPKSWSSPAPMPSEMIPSSQFEMPPASPAFSPLSPYLKTKKSSPPPSSVLTLPPPPPNQDCTSLTCTAPLTYSPPGSPCGCVWPIEVSLRLSIPLYTFFPLVTELAKEIAAAIALNLSQVRIMGANAANQQLDKTIVLVNLLPQDEKFDATSAFSIYKKFWKREVSIKTSNFGNYEVLYVRYPGLPPSPPSLSSSAASINDHGSGNDGSAIKPLGVDVPRRKHNGRDRNMIFIIVVSSATAFVVCMGFFWLLLLKCGCCTSIPKENPEVLMSSHRRLSGAAGSLTLGSRASSTMSRTSSILAYTGTAKVFSISDIEKATDNFDASRILGEGGFGLVYHGILDNGTKVAVKVLKREDQQGGREFLAEVEMLSRLHHRNLVKLIGICTEAHCRCLVYELVPNGSVESHLHGIDKEASPLDWSARMKIALGAARGLAYLHEDSSPRVIHRDFKSSNILLENDFTPKVSDFGLARAAHDEGNKHISTHVMGTFGYLAPEYAMTGHLLVKSDVYSYGVVLLELLTGRKPVDLSQPPGQENLVAWARPLLATKEGTEIFLDPALKSYAPVDGVAKVAAIASMCVQPEVSHRPFMGEVVQALTLVCNEFDETRETVSRSCSQEDFSIDMDSKQSRVSGELVEASQPRFKMSGYDTDFNAKIALSATDLKSVSAREESDSFRRQFNSAPLKMGRKRHFWQRIKFLPRGSMSEHGFSWKL